MYQRCIPKTRFSRLHLRNSKGEKAEGREDDAARREKLQKVSSAIALFTF